MSRIGSALVIADDPVLVSVLTKFLQTRAGAVHVARDRVQAERLLGACSVDAAVFDLSLGDTSEPRLVEILLAQPKMAHILVIVGDPSAAAAAFRLAQAGVRALIIKPFTANALERIWEETVTRAPDLRPLLRASVGRVRLAAVIDLVRQTMTEEAMAAARGSRRRASDLLGISRQLLQYTLRTGYAGGPSSSCSERS